MPKAILHDQHGATLAFGVDLTPLYVRYMGNVFAQQPTSDLSAEHYKIISIYTLDDDMRMTDDPASPNNKT